MKCPICNEETAGQANQRWGPEWAHRRCVVAYNLGRCDAGAEQPLSYASTQATNCAGCGEYKHTPLRIDAMGGYVCMTCIDRKLGTLRGEFGCQAPQDPLSDKHINALRAAADRLESLKHWMQQAADTRRCAHEAEHRS